jgi:transcription antitermination factor NusG
MEVFYHWYVLYTRSRHEKKVEQELINRGFESYCPKVNKLKTWADRKKWIEEPLFSLYCFVRVSERLKYEVLQVPGVVRFITYKDQLAKIKDVEIQQIKLLVSEKTSSDIKVENFNREDRVLINSGAFKDYEGLILDTKGKYFTIYLENLGIKLKLENKAHLLLKK